MKKHPHLVGTFARERTLLESLQTAATPGDTLAVVSAISAASTKAVTEDDWRVWRGLLDAAIVSNQKMHAYWP